MLEFWREIRQDPLLMSMLIFPIGNVILIYAAKIVLFPKTNPGNIIKEFLDEYRKHVQAEVTLDSHIKTLIDKVDGVVSGIWDFRRFMDLQLDDLKDFRDQAHTEHVEILRTMKGEAKHV